MGQPKSKLYIPLNEYTVDRINRLHKNDCGDYFDEEWLYNELEQIAEILQLSPETSTNDLISRQSAIDAVEKAVFKGVAKSAIESLPPVNQKQITGKLKNPCDSLLTEDSEGVKEQKSKLESEKVQLSPETSTNEGVAESATTTDCISRADAINVRCAYCDTRDCCRDCSEVEILLSLPPVTPTERTGEWLITDAYPHNVYCSECYTTFAQAHWGVWEDGSLPRNFCPNCGADMRENDYQRHIEDVEHCMRYEPTYNPEDGSM